MNMKRFAAPTTREAMALVLSAVLGAVPVPTVKLVTLAAVLPIMYQNVYGYSVFDTGLTDGSRSA